MPAVNPDAVIDVVCERVRAVIPHYGLRHVAQICSRRADDRLDAHLVHERGRVDRGEQPPEDHGLAQLRLRERSPVMEIP
jgi:hypothetical protein